jgi:hypothetical protein
MHGSFQLRFCPTAASRTNGSSQGTRPRDHCQSRLAEPWKGSLLARFQFKLLLGHFVKCLMLCLRTNSGEIAGGGRLILGCVSSFLNGFQNVVEFSEDNDGPEPTFLERQTLGEVFRETVGRVTGFSSPRAEHERDCEAEIEQLDALLRKFSRRVTSLLLSFGVAKNWNRSCDMFRETLRLLTRMVDDSLKPVLTSQPETERAAGEKVVFEIEFFCFFCALSCCFQINKNDSKNFFALPLIEKGRG